MIYEKLDLELGDVICERKCGPSTRGIKPRTQALEICCAVFGVDENNADAQAKKI